MSKFLKNLLADSQGIKEGRAKTLAAQAKKAKLKIISDLEDSISEKTFLLDKLNDLSPGTSVDLKYREDFVPKEWANSTHELELEITVLQMEMEVATNSFNNHFSEEA